MDALSEALGQIDPNVAKKQILAFVPAGAQRILAAAGIRDEHVFPVPAVLEKKPTLIGYYRLLLGISQKRFYRKGAGMAPFKSMETRGVLNPKKRPDLELFCTVMAGNLAELVRQISPKITARDVSELPLLTLGAQLYGSNNNAIGKQATLDVFLSVIEDRQEVRRQTRQHENRRSKCIRTKSHHRVEQRPGYPNPRGI
jgi:hypothetical protein